MKLLIHSKIVSMCMYDSSHRDVILAASTQELMRNMSRVKSSNIWARGINIKDKKSGVGDVMVQFKGSQGQPDDVYILYDVPIKLYQRWIAAPSAGHFYWVNLRNNFQYSKLTGDKRTKLRNGIN